MNSELIAVEWYAAVDTVGFVLVRDENVGFKCFVGVGGGFDAESDTRHIRRLGVKVPFNVAYAVFENTFLENAEDGLVMYDGLVKDILDKK